MRRASARTPRAAAAAGSSHSDRARANPARASTPHRNTGTCHNCPTDPLTFPSPPREEGKEGGTGPLGEAEFVAIALLHRRRTRWPGGTRASGCPQASGSAPARSGHPGHPAHGGGFYHTPPFFLKVKPASCVGPVDSAPALDSSSPATVKNRPACLRTPCPGTPSGLSVFQRRVALRDAPSKNRGWVLQGEALRHAPSRQQPRRHRG